MRILGIETSCDETAVAVVEVTDGHRRGQAPALRVVKNLVASQIKVHAKYGGVVPEVAARKHVEAIFPLLRRVGACPRPSAAGDKPPPYKAKIDLIAVTAGPGLAVALRVGVEVARTLSALLKVPVVGVNHLAGHIYSSLLPTPSNSPSERGRNRKSGSSPFEGEDRRGFRFPVLALIVSGGHTELVLMRKHGDYAIVGETRDDAAGEAFDKVAKMLGLGYPGGPIVSKMAEQGRADAIAFPRPMINSGDLDFSFSGLKTAVLYHVARQLRVPHGKRDRDVPRYGDTADICASFQQAVVDVLVAKTAKAVELHHPKTVVLCGGVAANSLLRKSLQQELADLVPSPYYLVPEIKYTGDNAAMIAAAAYFEGRKDHWELLGVNPGWRLGTGRRKL